MTPRREPGTGHPGMYATLRFVAVVLAASVVAALLPGADPLVIRVGESTFALRRAEAECVAVSRA